MSSRPDWKKRAENQYENERSEVERAGKSGFALYSLFAILFAMMLGVLYIGRWIFFDGKLIPTAFDIGWVSIMLVGLLGNGYFSERKDKLTAIHEERLIRLELKIDALLDRHEHVDSQLTDLRHEIWESRSR